MGRSSLPKYPDSQSSGYVYKTPVTNALKQEQLHLEGEPVKTE